MDNVRHLHDRDTAAEGGRVPPHDTEAEQAYLGGLTLAQPADQRRIHDLVQAGDFYRPAHTAIHQAAGALIDRGAPVDLITLTAELNRRGDINRVGGPAYVATVTNAAMTALATDSYAEIIRDCAARRRIVENATRILQHGYDDTVTAEQLRTLTHDTLTALDSPGATTALADGWTFSDLTPVLDGTHKPAQPDVGARDDGAGMFYPGHVNGITGESEAGKSWVALISCLVEMNRGNTVVYVDFEDSEAGVVSRLLLIGATPDLITHRFLYVRPGATPTPAELRGFIARVGELRPSLVIVDGVTEGMSLLGLELKDNTDVARFGRMLLRPLADTGAAVVPLDHVVKNSEARGRYALGGVHKLNAVDGVQYILEAVRPFGINTEGRSRLRIAKDRPAQVRPNALPGGRNPMHWYADLVIRSHGADFAEAHLYPPVERSDEPATTATPDEQRAQAEEQEITDREETILAVLGKSPDPMSKNALEAVISGRASVTRRALTRLVHTGRVTAERGTRGATLHRLPETKEDAS